MSKEIKEVKIPTEYLTKLEALSREAASSNGTKEMPTLGDVGVFDWLTKLSKTEGWEPVWQVFNFPYVILQRDVKD